MTRVFARYLDTAKRILDENWSGSSTKPAPSLYPHQWNWDSGFIAIGRSHYDTARAITEIESLFAAQWSNGMVPQIVFDPDALGHYFPEPDFWQAERSAAAPENKLTSGITMPPVHAIAVEKILDNAADEERVLPFVRRIYPKLLASHRYLYRERDPGAEGLVWIRHPWESGIDNSPTWDQPMRRIRIDRGRLPSYQRKDLDHGVAPEMRPSDTEYDRYVYLVDLFRRADLDDEAIRADCPFLIQDPLFNSVLCRADESLVRIAERIGEDPAEPRAWVEATARGIRYKLWNERREFFDAWDLVADARIDVDTAAGFMPLFAGAASRDQANMLYRRLDSVSFCALHQGNCFTILNYDTRMKEFDPSNYWRGPVWMNINWMLASGLRRYGYSLKADSLQKDLLQLPIRFGFHEYFDSFDGTGYGTDGFSWTAALFIDLVNEFYSRERRGPGLSSRITALVSPPKVLNRDCDPPDIDSDRLAQELMGCVMRLRDAFYDVRRGRVDYESLKESEEISDYRRLGAGLRDFQPSRLLGRRDMLAFWVNLYNSIVVDGIIALGIESSVKEVPSFFTAVAYDIGGDLYTPDDIEHGILRGNVRRWQRPLGQFLPLDRRRRWVLDPLDPRIHFALVCGSRSCAPIDYYDRDHVVEQLDEAAKSFVNSSEVVALPEEGKLLVSEIFRWYENDFGGRAGVLDFLGHHLVDDRAREFLRQRTDDLDLEYIYYDWNLNRSMA